MSSPKRKTIFTEREKEICEQIEVLRVTLFKARAHYEIGMGLNEHWVKFSRTIHASRTFWEFTLEGHFNTALVHLCRAFVEHKDAVTLSKFLNVVGADLALFGEKAFRERFGDRPRIEEWGLRRWNPNCSQLEKDKEFCSKSNQAVANLTKWRHKIVMHIDPQCLGTRRSNFMKQWPWPDMKHLITGGNDIVDRYNSAFQFVPDDPSPLDLDDYLKVLKSLSGKERQA